MLQYLLKFPLLSAFGDIPRVALPSPKSRQGQSFRLPQLDSFHIWLFFMKMSWPLGIIPFCVRIAVSMSQLQSSTYQRDVRFSSLPPPPSRPPRVLSGRFVAPAPCRLSPVLCVYVQQQRSMVLRTTLSNESTIVSMSTICPFRNVGLELGNFRID